MNEIIFEYPEGDSDAHTCLTWIESYSKSGEVEVRPLSPPARPKLSRVNGEVVIGYNQIYRYLKFRFPQK